MDKPELTAWATKNGWRERGGVLTLSKPSKPDHAIVRMVFLATVVHVEIRKPAGKWERVGGAAYRDIIADEDTGVPGGLGLEKALGGVGERLHQRRLAAGEPQPGGGGDVAAGGRSRGHDGGAEELLGALRHQRLAGHGAERARSMWGTRARHVRSIMSSTSSKPSLPP